MVFLFYHNLLFLQAVALTIHCTLLGLTISSLVFQYSTILSDYKPKFVLVSCSYAFFQHGLSNPVYIAMFFTPPQGTTPYRSTVRAGKEVSML